MVQQIKQVVVTYVTHRWVMAGIAAWLLLGVTPQLFMGFAGTKPPSELAPVIMMLLGMPIFFVSIMLVPQAKAQFAHWRNRIVPGFVLPHITVLASLLIVLVILFPLLVGWCYRFNPLGTTAMATAIAASAIWGSHSNRYWAMWVALAVFYSSLTTAGSNWWLVEDASNRPFHAMILATGIVLLIGWLWRLSSLREEMDDYQTKAKWRTAFKAGTEVAEGRRAAAEQLRRNKFTAWFCDVWMARLGGYHGGSLVRLARLLRYGFGLPAELQGVVMATWSAAIFLFMAKLGYLENALEYGPVHLYMYMAMICPGFFVGEWLAQRRPRIVAEVLLPLARSRLVEGLFAATAWSAALYWLAMNAGLVLVAWLSLGDQLSLAETAMMLLLTATSTFAMAGFGLRIAVWPSSIKRLAVLTVAIISLQVPLFVWVVESQDYSDALFLVLAVVMVLVGTILTRWAKNAWLNLELG